jgi:diguanylate cyclase (GGDEF)-like protein
MQQLVDSLCDLSSRDALTGLANRRSFENALARETDRVARSGEPALLLMLDIDHFKRINDHHGHVAGDLVIKAVAETLEACVRPMDLVARFGGEEFCVLCRGTDLNGARDLAERLRREIEDRRQVYGNKIIAVTISVGVAALPDPSMLQPTMLLTAADKALYDAKRAGRNCVVVATPGAP